MKIVELKVSRFKYSPKSTIGMLYVDNILFGYTLEDPVRRLEDKNKDGDFDDAGEGKIYGQTAIPAGTYEVKLTMSNRFKRILPELINVPGYKGVRIHNGNTPDHTEGCILVGATYKDDFVASSRDTLKSLMDYLKDADKITIRIK